MKDYLISVGAVLILTSCITLILPDGKSSKVIKPIFTILILLVIIKPLTSIKNFDFSFENNLENSFSYQNSYIDYTFQKRIELYKKNSNKIITELGVDGAKIDVLWEIKDDYELVIDKIKIDLSNAVYKENLQHIDITKEIKKSISNYLNISEEDVEIYG